MAATTKVRIGFISASGATSPHFEGFRALIPPDVEFDFEGLGLDPGSRYVAEDRTRATISAAQRVEKRGCQGIVVSGAPAEVMNPDLQQQLQTAVNAPVATAMTSCVAALKSFGARRVLLMTPFDAVTNEKIRAHLEARSIEGVSPSTAFGEIDEAMRLRPDEVHAFARASFEAAGPVEAVYFQGAVLDPLEIMDRLETEFACPVVASNPAMLWFILSKLGRSYRIDGCGRLLREWPTPVA
jgi:maleate cis-trans isomerase